MVPLNYTVDLVHRILVHILICSHFILWSVCRIDTNFVIKVADFGLSEDVYEKSYFRQGKSAVKLPIKWMALESSTDGIFSEKTDVVGVSVCSS